MWEWLQGWWDTIENVETFNLVMLICLGTAAVLAAVGTVGNVLAGRQLDRLKSQRDAAQQAAREQELRHQIAERERELREVPTQQRARTLTLEQVQALIPRLRVGPKGKVQIEVLGEDPEADQFGEQFYEVLKIAGWPVEEGIAVTQVRSPSVGLQLGASPAGMPPHGEFLLQALRDVGLDVSSTTPIRGPKELVHLVVGAQPHPRHTP